MTLLLDEVRVGQQPRIVSLPALSIAGAAGDEAVELCRMAGLELDWWQELVLRCSLAERADGKWAAFEVAMCVPRQNGKGSIFEARELTGLFLLGERLLIHSAHQFDTSLEAFRRLLFLIEDTPEFDSRVKRVSRSHGEEGIELKSGQRIRFRTRTKGGGRGFTGDWIGLDEAMFLPEATVGALMPTVSARPNPQVWYAGSAVDQLIHDHGYAFARIRDRAIAGGDPSLAYFEWSVDARSPVDVPDDVFSDPAAWAVGNPALGIRISEEHVGNEYRSMDRRTFAVERLGVGDWPALDMQPGQVIAPKAWDGLRHAESSMVDPVWLAADVAPDRAWASIGVAGRTEDGLWHVEIADRRAGVGWLVPRLAEIVAKHQPAGVVIDSVGPVASLKQELVERGVTVTQANSQDHAQACGILYDAVRERQLRHTGQASLQDAVRGATKRPLGDAWAWSRKNSSVDISPLVAVTLALWGAAQAGAQVFVL